jgi:hypothetical protein
VRKAEIIVATLKSLRGQERQLAPESSDALAYKRRLTAYIEKKLDSIEPHQDIPTCADFAHLGVECCHICHKDCPQYELAIGEIESGGRAWLCCSLDRALNPRKHAAIEETQRCRRCLDC